MNYKGIVLKFNITGKIIVLKVLFFDSLKISFKKKLQHRNVIALYYFIKLKIFIF